MTPPRRAPRRGLTLLEVLLSLAILAVALAAIGKLVDVGSARGNEARFTIRGARLAQSKMAEVEAGLIPISGGAGGQFTDDDAAWSYQVTSAPVSTPASPPNLYTVTVTVSRTFQGVNANVTLTQMMFDPTKLGTAAQAEAATASTGTTGTTGTTGSGTTGSGGTSP
jgi:prepilin-type N-terminal cleavage/methylation domain-containing protein